MLTPLLRFTLNNDHCCIAENPIICCALCVVFVPSTTHSNCQIVAAVGAFVSIVTLTAVSGEDRGRGPVLLAHFYLCLRPQISTSSFSAIVQR
jgi:hypothetical protein